MVEKAQRDVVSEGRVYLITEKLSLENVPLYVFCIK